jgi:phage tail protein X
MRLVIIGCGKSKIWDKHHDIGPQKAEDIYTSGFAAAKRKYAQSQGCDWMILSAKYGFIRSDFIIPETYNVTFKDTSTHPISLPELKKQVEEQELGRYDEIAIVGGAEYIKATRAAFSGTRIRVDAPFERHRMGDQMHMMLEETRKRNHFSE